MCSPPSWIGGGVPERITVFCRASSIRLIRAARSPMVAAQRSQRSQILLQKDRKSLTYSLPSSRTGVGQRGSVPCAAIRWHVVCVQNTTQNVRSMQDQWIPRVRRLDSGKDNHSPDDGRSRTGNKWLENILDKMSHCSLSCVRAKDNGQIEQARITMLKFALIRWLSWGFSPKVIQGEWMHD